MSKRGDAQQHYEEGLHLQDQGAITRAIHAFSAALIEDPAFFEAAYRLGRCQESLERWTFAVDSYRQGLAIDPSSLEAATALAEALRQAGCYHDADQAFDICLKLDNEQLFALAGKAETQRMLGRADQSLKWFDRALAKQPEHVFALRGKAAALNSLGQFNESIDLWSRSMQIEPDSMFAVHGRQEAEAGLLNPDSVEPLDVDMEADLEGKALAAHRSYVWGRALMADRRTEDAISAFEDALEQAPDRADYLTDLAMALEDVGRWDEALAGYRALLDKSNDDVAAATNIGEVLRKSARAREAVEAYASALSIDPDYVYALAGRGEAARNLGEHEEAIKWFERALERRPTHAFALRGKAASLNALERYDQALPVWNEALQLEPDSEFALHGLEQCRGADRSGSTDSSGQATWGAARVHLDLGKALLQQSRFDEAIQYLQRATDAHPGWQEPWLFLGVAFERSKRFDEALEAFRAVLGQDPEHLDAGLHLADALRKMSRFREAIDAYDRVLVHYPAEVRGLSGTAESLRMLGDYEEGRVWFDRSLALRPGDFFSLCGKAACLNALHRFEEALPVWTKAREAHPGSAFALKGLAYCELALRKGVDHLLEDISMESVPTASDVGAGAQGPITRQAACDEVDRGRSFHKDRDYESAIECFERALQLDPTFTEGALRLGMAYEDNRQYRQAIAAYETCLQLESDHFQAATNIGEAYRKNEQYVEAIDAYDRALQIKHDYLYALAGRAECMRMLGKYESCLEWFDRALSIGQSHAFAIQGRAAALNALQRFQEALPLWDRALDIEPQSQFALDGKAYCEAQLRRTDDGGEEQETPVEGESATPTLDEQGRDLTALAKAGRLPNVIGRRDEIRAVQKTLVRRLKANPILLGEPGVGKTAVVEGVAQCLIEDSAPKRLRGLRIIELSMGALVAGTKYRGTFEERLREIIKEASSQPGIVLFIDEIHTLVGAGRTEGGSLDAANILKPALARGEITVIGATTQAEFRRHFESDSALERRFQPIQIEEPSEEETITLLNKVKRSYEEHHNVKVERPAVESCVRMAVRYVPDRRLPDKALDLLDEACAEASLSDETLVTRDTVAKVVSERTGVPVQSLTEAERGRMKRIEEELGKSVVGQDQAIALLARTVRLTKARLRDPMRPHGVFLFHGRSGVGKTQLAKALADFVFQEGDALIRLDMSEYTEKFTVSRLVGAPPGYSGHGEEGQLTGPLRRHPYSVVLLDEFEKAHEDVQALFLSLFDEGMITDADGRPVNAREAFFILTTNAGTSTKGSGHVGFSREGADPRKQAFNAVRPWFKPELLNRIDEVITFNQLDKTAMAEIVRRNLTKLQERASAEGVSLSWDEDVVSHILAHPGEDAIGARPVLRAIDELVGEPLGGLMLDHKSNKGCRFHASMLDGKVHFERESPRRSQKIRPEEPV